MFGSNMDEHNCWFKFFNYILNPTIGFVHVWPKQGLKQPSIFFNVQEIKFGLLKPGKLVFNLSVQTPACSQDALVSSISPLLSIIYSV